MEPFPASQEPDEGYSEHPLNNSDASGLDGSSAVSGLHSSAELPAWLRAQLPRLSVQDKRYLALLILNELPTTVIADIVMTDLNPRLYIDFVRYLPPEICLKILGYLDSVSLIHVAMCCRGWYDLALDRKLWEKLYYLEGWKVIPSEISTAERRMNEGSASAQIHHHKVQSVEDGHAHKKRAVSDPTVPEDDDYEMVDADMAMRPNHRDTDMSGTSLFGSGAFGGPHAGGSGSSMQSNTSVIQHMGNLIMKSPSPMPDIKGKGIATPTTAKGKAAAVSLDASVSQAETTTIASSLPKQTLWIHDSRNRKFKISWKYLYSMRRKLEQNWERGRYVNFQLPHPDHPEEGHDECIYSLQYNPEYLVSGSRDRTLRIWNLRTRRLLRKPLTGHNGSVLCLQFDSDPQEDLIVSGSSDSNVILWKFSTGEILQRIFNAHRESVLNVKFDKRILVTCSKDKSIKIFNRQPLRPGDLGYGSCQVNPVPINVARYGYENSPLDQLPIKPPYTLIGSLEGHNAAVNAVQIYDTEIVSASGDRHIKVWDWPSQVIKRTFIGHQKGIACVQYDGRRIVSGSSDNEVKVFDRESGLEVASLRAHATLVRTVQAGFGDRPYSREEDRLEAKAVDHAYFKALNTGTIQDAQSSRSRPHNAGSRRPEDITAYGAKLPPGGGGGPYGRIVSGSYDQTIIIWRRDREGIWRSQHILRQEEGAAAALRQDARPPASVMPRRPLPLPADTDGSGSQADRPSAGQPPPTPASAPPTLQRPPPSYTQVEHPIHATITPQTTTSYTQMIDTYVPQGPAALQQALSAYPTMLSYNSHIQRVIDREPDAITRSLSRQVVNAAMSRAQRAQNRIHDAVQRNLTAYYSAAAQYSAAAGPSTSQSTQAEAHAEPSRPALVQTLTPQPISSATSLLDGSSSEQTAPGGSGGGPPTGFTNNTHPPPSVQPQQPQQQQQTSSSQPQPLQAQTQPVPAAPAPAPVPGPQQPHTHPHMAQADASPARIFKLQFDARRIICCSQTSTIVGWDFCNGDAELEEAARFFGTVD
ncbi:WD40 repeat-like protein [Xylariaceae sp. FL0804]|nr:WD40 repeat-like protein [Xylariaceae sp. FL0804]